MFSSLSLLVTASLYLLTVVDAAPSKRQTDNGACQQLATTCVKAVDKSLNNVFAIESCILAATCFSGQRPVDNFLAFVSTAKNGNNAAPPQSVNLPRVTSAALNSISTNGKTITQQNFIDAFYRQLSVSNGPWPSSADIVISYYNRVAVWTAFCAGNVPFRNFQDYFQYSASISSPGCGVSSSFMGTTTLVSLTTASPIPVSTTTIGQPGTVLTSSTIGQPGTVITSSTIGQSGTTTPSTISSTLLPSSTVTPSTISSTLLPSSTVTPSTISSTLLPSSTVTPSTISSTLLPSSTATPSTVSSTLLPSTTFSIPPPTSSPPTLSPDATCQQMFYTCTAQVNSAVTNLWSIKACVLGAACVAGSQPVGTFASAVHSWKRGGSPPTAPVNQPRVSTALFNAGSTDGGKTWTQQNFIDAYYSQLSATGGPFPPNANLIIGYYQRIAAWTGFCGKAIPYMNFADYFQWSATVNGPATTC